jgi:hypothetical protein
MIAADANDPKGIVWIASYPKSGSTWVRVFLYHLVRMLRGRPLEDRDLDRLGATSPSAAGRVDLYETLLGKPLASADMRDIVRVRAGVQEAIMREANGIVAVKTHSFLGRVFETPLINLGVSAGAVDVVRNPLDVAVSLAPHLQGTIDGAIHSMGVTLNASRNTGGAAPEIWGSWSENVGSWTTDPPPVIKVVRYEDLLLDPVGSFTAIAEHMRLGGKPVEIGEAVRLASFDRLAAEEEETGGFSERPEGVERFFRVGRAGQWRDALSDGQVDRIVAAHGEQMRRFGYLPVH